MNAPRILRSSALLAAAVAMMFSAGCDNSESSTSVNSTAKPEAGRKAVVVGYSQIGAESAWRTAATKSIQDEAKKRGIELKFSDAQQKQENQIAAVRSFIAQGVDVILISPVVETGWEPVLTEAKEADIPVVLVDRTVKVPDDSLWLTWIGSDFVKEGEMAGEWLVTKTGGKANIVELTGTPGSAPATDRATGFKKAIEGKADMKIIRSQTGDFTRAKGKEVMEAILKSPEGKTITALYAHNDDMALGAIQAIEAAGLKPGKDIIIVSIDAVGAAFDAMIEGKLNCTVECNPLLGPGVFDIVEKIVAGEKPDKKIYIQDEVFPAETAKEIRPSRKY